jgi:hypothetical protein
MFSIGRLQIEVTTVVTPRWGDANSASTPTIILFWLAQPDGMWPICGSDLPCSAVFSQLAAKMCKPLQLSCTDEFCMRQENPN